MEEMKQKGKKHDRIQCIFVRTWVSESLLILSLISQRFLSVDQYILNRKHIFAQPLLAFNVEVGSKLWTKFIEKVEIHQRRPNSEHILNYNFGRLQQKTEWGLGSLEVTMASKLFLNLFWLNSLDQPQLQPQIWPLDSSRSKKCSDFAVFMAMMAIQKIVLPSAAIEPIFKSNMPK